MRRRMIWGESQPLTFVALEDATFSFTNNVEYKIGSNAWQTLSAGESTSTVPQGEKIKWRGNLTNPVADVGIGTFSSTGRYNAEGNLLSLVLYNRFAGVKVMPNKTYLFQKLFYQDANLVSTKNLKLVCTTLRDYCYAEMFRECTSLVESCNLPAPQCPTYGYSYMFCDCSSLIETPYIAATGFESRCFEYMFLRCSSLTTITNIPKSINGSYTHYGMFHSCISLINIPQSTLVSGRAFSFSIMFYGCTSLIDASNISFDYSNINLQNSMCSKMFEGCTSLEIPPKEIPNGNLGSATYVFNRMFADCTSLQESPIIKLQTTLQRTFNEMFDGCSNLQKITCLTTGLTGRDAFLNWVRGVSATGTFIKNPNATWTRTGVSGIPTGWTVEDAEI